MNNLHLATDQWAFVIAANRAPVEITSRSGAELQAKRGAGGLASALLPMAASTNATWIACSRNSFERALCEKAPNGIRVRTSRGRLVLKYALIDEKTYNSHYRVICNQILWFLHHYLWNLPTDPVVDQHVHDAWHNGYVKTNQLIAEAILQHTNDLQKPAIISIHDYQLYLVAKFLADRLEGSGIHHYVHVPWPSPSYWKILPEFMRTSIIEGLLSCQLIGFQTQDDVLHFLETCKENHNLEVDFSTGAIYHDRGITHARCYPIQADAEEFQRLSKAAKTLKEENTIDKWRSDKLLILRVDRTDPAKNIIRGFLAFERMLQKYPEWKGKVIFWAFLQPSRQEISVYRKYRQNIKVVAERINRKYQTEEWQPVRLEFGQDIHKVAAGYKNFDVLIVNPLYDGMNLVAKEGMLINERAGVLVLSENAGSHRELGQHAITISPCDIEQTADALKQALEMDFAEKAHRAEEIKRIIKRHTMKQWAEQQIGDLISMLKSDP